MNLGAKAVVAAGWAVDDRAACVFAERFYQYMLKGERFGDAVLAARKHASQLFPSSNTWGAYQCYGNPDFRLDGMTRDGHGDGRARRYVAREEVLQELQDIEAQAGGGDRKKLLDQLEELSVQTPVEWRDGQVLAAFGRAYGELGEFEKAIATYRQALIDESGTLPLRTVQQLANFLERSSHQKSEAERGELQEEASKLLDHAQEVADTAELASIRGALYKRSGKREEALKCYQSAFDKLRQMQNDGLYYPGLNVVALAYVLKRGSAEEWEWWIQESEDAARREQGREVWPRIALVDAKLLRHLWRGTMTDAIDELVHEYDDVTRSSGSPRVLDSVLRQINFLRTSLPADDPAQDALQRIADLLRFPLAGTDG